MGGFNLNDIESMDDEAVDALASQLFGDDDGDDAPEGEGTKEPSNEGSKDGTPSEEPAPGSEGRDDQPPPQAGSQGAPRVVGKDLIESLRHDPEAQAIMKQELDRWVKEASASAEAKKQQEEFQKLIEEGDYEEIGKRFVSEQQSKAVRTAAQEEALTRAYSSIYGKLFGELDKYELTDAEKLAMQPTNFDTDESYILHLSTLAASKRAGDDIEQRANKRAEEILQALANQKAAEAAGGGSPSNIPGATETAGNRNESSRDLISSGFRESYEEFADRRTSVS